MQLPDTPDRPDPSAVPSLFDLIVGAGSCLVAFPAYLLVQVEDPLSVALQLLIYCGVIFDGVFWALIWVAVQRFLGWHFQKQS